MITLKVLRCIDCGAALAAKYTLYESRKDWLCTECAIKRPKVRVSKRATKKFLTLLCKGVPT